MLNNFNILNNLQIIKWILNRYSAEDSDKNTCIYKNTFFSVRGWNITFAKTYSYEKTKLAFIGPQPPSNCVINSVDFAFFNSESKVCE